MKKTAKKINSMMFDVAVAPTLLAPMVGPVIIKVVVGILIFSAAFLIIKARKKNIEVKRNQDSNNPFGNDE